MHFLSQDVLEYMNATLFTCNYNIYFKVEIQAAENRLNAL